MAIDFSKFEFLPQIDEEEQQITEGDDPPPSVKQSHAVIFGEKRQFIHSTREIYRINYHRFDVNIREIEDLYEKHMQVNIRGRADVLFGSVRVKDTFEHFPFGDFLGCNNRQPFRIVPSEFIRHARKMRPENPEATVSAFASWLYSLYSNAYGDEEDRERGKTLEPAIFERRKMAQGGVDDGYLRSIGSEWRLVHNGLHLPGQDSVTWFSIDHLRVNGEALRASPDLIYRHPRLNEVMIVEIKHSFMEIPSNLWPNLWGQLWCYSQLDIARSASKVTVVGEVWGERKHWDRRGNSEDFLHLRASERRDPRVPAYDRFFRTLFEIFSGHNGTRRE